MIPIVPNVDARAAVEIPCCGAGVPAAAVVVGISGCNGITYFRYKLILPVEAISGLPLPKNDKNSIDISYHITTGRIF